MKEKKYNIWFRPSNRWTRDAINGMLQDPEHPFELSFENAVENCNRMNAASGRTYDETYVFEVRELKVKNSKPMKIIPNFPLDTSLHILQAGHIQDRQRKYYKA